MCKCHHSESIFFIKNSRPKASPTPQSHILLLSQADLRASFLLAILLLQRRVLKSLTHTSLQLLPAPKLNLWRPGQDPNPRLYIIMDFQHHTIQFRELSSWGCDLVFCFLVLELEFSPIPCQPFLPLQLEGGTYLEGSILFPFALLSNFFIADGPIFCK
jgi:hypothetical protein